MSVSTDNTILPNHIGLILDGNRRWAKQHELPAVEGHRQGVESFRTVTLDLFGRGISYVSAYIFSVENWSRSKDEVSYLMKLVIKLVSSTYLEDFQKAGICIRMAGSRQGVSEEVLAAIDKAEASTAANTAGTLVLCFNYGGQDEIINATRTLLKAGVQPDELTQERFAQALYQPDVPPLDLVIRTSGEQRISGFMLYRAAYAELYFTDTFWPDMIIEDMDKALAAYAKRQRRYGT